MIAADAIVLPALIFLAAILYTSVGHAGASGYLAAMALVGMAPEAMRPTALALNILVASIATYRYAKAGHFDWRTFLPFTVAAVPMAFLGGALQLPPGLYRAAVGVVLLLAAAEMARSARRATVTERATQPPVVPAMAIGGVIGLLSGITGTGGGIFLSPVLLIAGWTGTRRTSGVSAAFILCNSVAALAGATITWAALPAMLPLWMVIAAVGGLIGTQLGRAVLPLHGIRYALAAVLAVAGGKLILG